MGIRSYAIETKMMAWPDTIRAAVSAATATKVPAGCNHAGRWRTHHREVIQRLNLKLKEAEGGDRP